jgi:hypothetical protein
MPALGGYRAGFLAVAIGFFRWPAPNIRARKTNGAEGPRRFP